MTVCTSEPKRVDSNDAAVPFCVFVDDLEFVIREARDIFIRLIVVKVGWDDMVFHCNNHLTDGRYTWNCTLADLEGFKGKDRTPAGTKKY